MQLQLLLGVWLRQAVSSLVWREPKQYLPSASFHLKQGKRLGNPVYLLIPNYDPTLALLVCPTINVSPLWCTLAVQPFQQ